ncbi:MAG: hypothetical protein ACT4QA_03870 [Panacagrimonas sp.]
MNTPLNLMEQTMNVKNLLPKRLLLTALTCISATMLIAGPVNAGGHGGAGRPAISNASSVEVTQLRQRLIELEERLEKLEGQDLKVSAFRLSPADRAVRNGAPTAGE